MRQDEEVHAGGSCSRAEDGDPLRVSAEVPDVLVEPAQSLNLVQQAVVPFSRLISSTEETWMFQNQSERWRVQDDGRRDAGEVRRKMKNRDGTDNRKTRTLVKSIFYKW